MISRVKVTVIKTFTKEDIFRDNIPESLRGRNPCSRHKEGKNSSWRVITAHQTSADGRSETFSVTIITYEKTGTSGGWARTG